MRPAMPPPITITLGLFKDHQGSGHAGNSWVLLQVTNVCVRHSLLLMALWLVKPLNKFTRWGAAASTRHGV